jgi:cytochrome c-type biogenesis protein CcmH/NrfF
MNLNVYIGLAAAGTVCLLALWQMIRCVHAWELVDKTELPSRIEDMAKCGLSLSSLYKSQVDEMSRRTVILALRCPKCGAAKIHREVSA